MYGKVALHTQQTYVGVGLGLWVIIIIIIIKSERHDNIIV